ncbi:MAG: M4 family peptidase [Cytophagales bacterium]|nr:MAG: M4 family peptidase [Cytophagales bacterium]
MSTDVVKENFRLCYAFNIAPETKTESYRIFVDATTGAIVRRLPLFANCFGMHNKPHAHPVKPALAAANSVSIAAAKSALIAATFIPNYARYLNGQAAITFETQQVGNQDPGNTVNILALQNTTLNTRIDAFNTELWANNPDVQRTGLAWGNEVPNATTAHWLTQRMYQYYQTKHGRNGIDGNGRYPRVLVNWREANAQWDSPNSTIRFGNLRGASLVTADVLGHEYAHAVDEYTSNLIYEGEPGAIDESIADIMGTALERYVLPNNWNWNWGDDFGTERSLSNPTLFGQPNNYTNRLPINPPCIGGRHPAPPGGNDFCEVHTNSGIMNHWFYRIAEPTSTSSFIGFDEAADLVYKTQRYYLHSTSNYNDVRDATWAMAGSTYGTCSDVQRKVAAAWRAVGLQILDCPPGCDYSLNTITVTGSTNCNGQITLTTNCNGAYGESCNGVSYSWSGPNIVSNGGTTATATLPSSGGSQLYFVSGTKSGCIPGSFRAALVEVNCGQSSCNTISSGNCYTLKVQKNGLRLQVMGDGTIQQQNANNQNNQIWKVEDTGGNQFKFTTQDGTNRVITSNSGNFGEWLSLSGYNGATGQKWHTQCNGSNHYRMYRDNGSTWDVKDYGNSPQLQLYGNTGESFFDYRSFEFQPATCPTGTPPPPPPPSGGFAVIAPAYNCQTGALTMQTSGGNGSSIEYQIPGLRGWETNPNFTVPSWQLNGTQFTLQARQSGTQAPSYQYTTGCGGTPPPHRHQLEAHWFSLLPA